MKEHRGFGLVAVALAAGLMGCEAAAPDEAGGGEQTPPTTPAGMARVERLLRVELAPDHTVDFFRFKDGTFAYNEIAKVQRGGAPRLTELANALGPVELFRALAPGKEVPGVLTQPPPADGGEPETIAAAGSALGGFGGLTVVAHDPGRTWSTGMSGCPVSYVADHPFHLCNRTSWPPNGDNDWCLLNGSWAFYDRSGSQGDASLCVDSGTSRFYVEHDANEYTEVSVPAGSRSSWSVSAQYRYQWWTTSYVRNKGRHMKFGFHPGGVAHFYGDIKRD